MTKPQGAAPRVLFVCSVLGARSYIACHFLNLHSKGEVLATPSGFEEGSIGPMMRRFLIQRKILIPDFSPKTVFERHRDSERYDHVVTLCSDSAKELCPVFLKSVSMLYPDPATTANWQIGDFRTAAGTPNCEEIWDGIVQDIDHNCAQFARELMPDQV
ncbi:MAG: hypothetical protein ACWA5K_06420 [bacterium]